MHVPPRARNRPGRPPKSQAGPTRELLLDAALKLFAARGFAATTVRQIASAVGVTDAAIYFHFANKRAILQALMDETGAALLERFDDDGDSLSERDPAEAIPAVFAGVVERFDQPRARLLTSMLLRHEPARINDALSRVEAQLHPVMRAWATRGRLRSDVSPEFLVFELIAPLATLRLAMLHGEASDAQRARARDLARQHLEFFVASHVRPQ